jgi:cellulose synthase/poly-beta-1,6-N-acetylglucosamine synthase-like glycosyltransferase
MKPDTDIEPCISTTDKREDEKPFVSVIVPVFHGERFIDACLEALLSQSYPSHRFEVLVIDNNASDRCVERIRTYPVRYLQERATQSAYAARNRGIREARGDVLAFTDVDCIVSPEWIEVGVQAFADPNVGAVSGAIDSNEATTWVQRHLVRRHFLSQDVVFTHYFRPYAQTANVFYRRSVFDQVGLFEPGWISGSDADLAWRMQLLTPLKLCHAAAATVWHRHRSTLRGLLEQRYRHGLGSAALRAKYGRQVARPGSADVRRALTLPRLNLVDLALHFLVRTAYLCGRALGSSPIGLGRNRQDEYPCPYGSPLSSARSTAPGTCEER